MAHNCDEQRVELNKRVEVYDNHQYDGFIYLPDPMTKEEHFQPATMLELLLPKIEGIKYNEQAEIEVPSSLKDKDSVVIEVGCLVKSANSM